MSGEGKSDLDLKKRRRDSEVEEIVTGTEIIKKADRINLITWTEDTGWTTIDPTPYTQGEIPKYVYVLLQLHFDGAPSDPDQDWMRAFVREDESDETILIQIEGYTSYQEGTFAGYCRQCLAAFVKCSAEGKIEAMLETVSGEPDEIFFKIFLLDYI